jgi:hypothetical protein
MSLRLSLRLVLSALVSLSIVTHLAVNNGLYAAIGDCTKKTIHHQQFRCENLTFCVTVGAPCGPTLNAVDCGNGKVASYVRWVTASATGTCQSVTYYANCFECPGDITCGIGDGYEDADCFFPACSIIRVQGPNRCVRS